MVYCELSRGCRACFTNVSSGMLFPQRYIFIRVSGCVCGERWSWFTHPHESSIVARWVATCSSCLTFDQAKEGMTFTPISHFIDSFMSPRCISARCRLIQQALVSSKCILTELAGRWNRFVQLRLAMELGQNRPWWGLSASAQGRQRRDVSRANEPI